MPDYFRHRGTRIPLNQALQQVDSRGKGLQFKEDFNDPMNPKFVAVSEDGNVYEIRFSGVVDTEIYQTTESLQKRTEETLNAQKSITEQQTKAQLNESFQTGKPRGEVYPESVKLSEKADENIADSKGIPIKDNYYNMTERDRISTRASTNFTPDVLNNKNEETNKQQEKDRASAFEQREKQKNETESIDLSNNIKEGEVDDEAKNIANNIKNRNRNFRENK
jgi:hypothetical protein